MSKKNLVRERVKNEAFYIRLPSDLARAVRDLSDKSELSINATITHLLEAALKEKTPESG